jgi:arylsulfatase A-like enzyme
MTSRRPRLDWARGLCIGALAGVWVAFADYGATWLWLPLARDRLWLLLRLLALLVPVGALLGAAGAGLAGATWRALHARFPRRSEALWPLPFVLLAGAPSLWLARMLCSGGMMARLAQRYPLQLGFSLLLPAGLYLTLRLALVLARRVAAAGERRKLEVALALLGASLLMGKLNQWLLPNLYDYLHALLALAVWSVAALGLGLLCFGLARFARVAALLDRPVVWATSAAALALLAVVNTVTLDHNLNVRVAMFDARSPSSRALLASVEPDLRKLDAPRAPRRGRALAQPARTTLAGLPTAPGAHVLLVTIDALRADHLGSYGYPRPVSPRLDALAKQAVVFERAYAQAPHSSYSLSSLHTSEYVHEVVALSRPLPKATLASALTEHGYHTAAFFTDGIFHTEGSKLVPLRDSAFGFALFDHTNRESEQQTDRVLAEVERIKQRGEPPSLLWVHYFDVHEPYQETTFGSGEMERYDSEILHVDRELSRLIEALDARLERDVVIAITADHGEEFRDHGGVYHGSTLFDEQVRVPLIVRLPGLSPGRFAAPVESIDIAPTLLAAVGAPVPTSMRGRDLRALATGKAEAGPVFSAVLTKRMALAWPYKLIADLRFDLFELYDLATDPQERRNLAGQQPARLAALRELVYGWLDGIDAASSEPAQHGAEDAGAPGWERALHLGRLGDRRAVALTSQLLLTRTAPTEARVEAGQILAKLADPSSVPALLEGLHTVPPEVAAEAAIALGRLYDDRARPPLLKLMHVEDPHLRARAAVSLGRLRDPAAVPALIDALWVAPTQYEREEAVRWLGRIRDPRAVEPLLSLLPEFGLRYLLAVALGQIGDARAYDALLDMLTWESRTNIRDEVVRGLGLLGDPRALPTLLRVLRVEPALKNTAESLVRLGALERGLLGGVDVGKQTRGMVGLSSCAEGPLLHDWDYLQRTSCTSTGPRVQLSLPLPGASSFEQGAELLLRVRRVDAAEATQCALQLAGAALATLSVDGEFVEQRLRVSASALQTARVPLVLSCQPATARVALDHALLLPLPASDRTEPAQDAQVVGQ